MSFPRYPAYKPSGVEWLGEVPEHWEVKRIASLYREVVEQGSDELPVLSVSIHHGVSDSELSEEEMDRKVTRSEDRSKYKRVTPGDLVYNMMRSWQGAFGTVCVEGMVSPAYVVARPTSNVPSTWIEYLLRTEPAISEIKRFSRGITDFRLRLYWDEFKNLRVCLPPSNERGVLLRFLDHETAKIDALIAEQQRLIELLQEKRQAVISHAVTKGLNPDAPMKDTVVEWLGEVPEHWEVVRFKRFCELQRGHDLTNEEREDGPHPVVTSAGINGFHSQYIAKAPGVVTGWYGSTGTVFFIEQDYWPHNTSLYIKDFHKNSPRFSWYLLQAIDLNSLSVKSAVPGIDRNDVHELFVASPDLSDQNEVATYLDNYCRHQARLVQQAESSTELLQERRSALISAAVTGQIDVRGLVPEAEAA
jgi:type I restriction enzyme S subunit